MTSPACTTPDTAASGTRVSSNFQAIARKMAAKYPAGIEIHYNPDNPAESVLSAGSRWLLLLWLLPLGMLALAYFVGR